MKKIPLYIIVIIVGLIIIAGIYWYFTSQKEKLPEEEKFSAVFDSDATVSGDYLVEQGEKVLVKNSATLTIEGSLTVKGNLVCQNGPLNLVVIGDLTIEGKLECDRGQELPEGDIGAGISIVVSGSFSTGKDSEIVTNGHLQIVDNIDYLLTTKEEIDQFYEEIAQDTGEGNRIGPFVPEGEETPSSFQDSASQKIAQEPVSSAKNSALASLISFFKGSPVYAQRMIPIWGRVRINTPPRGTKLIVLLRMSNIAGFIFEDFLLIGPDANNGRDDEDECEAEGGTGEDALRFYAYAPNIVVNNFDIFLGSGGHGGKAKAVASDECKDVTAIGGTGGESGNLKMVASQSFEVRGALTIYPGWSGNGGDAFAYAGDCKVPVERGGNATAIGGDAADNIKKLRARGSVGGLSNIKVGPIYGGFGGNAYAYGGKGCDGRACKSEDGGPGGDATAQAGDGGDALVFIKGLEMGRTDDDVDIGGDAGDVEAKPGKGGDGSDCSPTKAGGNGGRGGDAEVIPGEPGFGGVIDGQETEIRGEAGGNGGNGGDGCPPGAGGSGGSGNPPGQDGLPGTDLCPPPGEEEELPPGEEEEPPGEEEEEPPPEPEPTFILTLEPTDISFEHTIGLSPCPQLIDTVNISNNGTGTAGSWVLESAVPDWLSMYSTGSVPQAIDVDFSCVLEEYVTQTVSTTLNFRLLDGEGQPVGNQAQLNVTGYISGE